MNCDPMDEDTMTTGSELLTHSRAADFQLCKRKHYYAYEAAIRTDRESQPLRMGSAVHLGLELMAGAALLPGLSLNDALDRIRANYADVPEWADAYDWSIECVKVCMLLEGYAWRWADQPVTVLETEATFNLPIRNPAEGGRTSRCFRLAGKRDKYVELWDGRRAIMEHKTTSEDLSDESDYWRRLRVDSQISLYCIAAQDEGKKLDTVIYDVIRKPTIKPCQIPILDSEDQKMVMGENGFRAYNANGKPRQSGNAAKGFRLIARKETPDEYSHRLLKDIAARPDWYYARHKIPRLDANLEAFRRELWGTAQALRWHQKHNHWPRNTAVCSRPYACPYRDICWADNYPIEETPVGFKQLDYIHPELRGNNDETTRGTTEAATEAVGEPSTDSDRADWHRVTKAQGFQCV